MGHCHLLALQLGDFRNVTINQEVPETQPILEVNPEHPLIKKLESSEQFDDLAQVIFDQALLADGGQLDDPAAYLKRVNELLMR